MCNEKKLIYYFNSRINKIITYLIMICKNFEHNIILYLLIVILIFNSISIYNDKSEFINYKKLSFMFVIMTIIFVILVIMSIKKNKNNNKTHTYARYFLESDFESDDSYENMNVNSTNDSNDSNDDYDDYDDYDDDLTINFVNEILIEN